MKKENRLDTIFDTRTVFYNQFNHPYQKANFKNYNIPFNEQERNSSGNLLQATVSILQIISLLSSEHPTRLTNYVSYSQVCQSLVYSKTA